MKALDKSIDTQVITGIIMDKFTILKQKENFSIWRRKETGKKDGIKVTIVTEEIQQNLSKSKWMEHWTMSSYKLYDSIDFENLTGKFWIKNIRQWYLKELSLKADGIKFH